MKFYGPFSFICIWAHSNLFSLFSYIIVVIRDAVNAVFLQRLFIFAFPRDWGSSSENLLPDMLTMGSMGAVSVRTVLPLLLLSVRYKSKHHSSKPWRFHQGLPSSYRWTLASSFSLPFQPWELSTAPQAFYLCISIIGN